MADKNALTPWRVGETRHDYDCVIRNRDNDPVAITNIAGYGTIIGRFHAALIVSAVNRDHLFGELVDALKAVLDETVDESAVRRARAALAEVKSQS